MLSSFPSQTDMCRSLFVGCDPLFSAMCSLKLCNQAAESYLKDLPFYLPATSIFKDWSRVYLSVIQVSLFCSLSEIYIVHKYNDLKSEKHCYLIYKGNCNVHISHWDSWELSKCITLSLCPSAFQNEAPWLGCSAFSAFCRKLWFLSHPII